MGDRQNPGQPHPVWVASFHLAAFEVTNGEFRRFLADPAGYDDRANWTAAGWAWKATGLSQATARLPPSDERYPRFGRDDLPVMLVTWYEASAYCRWSDPRSPITRVVREATGRISRARLRSQLQGRA